MAVVRKAKKRRLLLGLLVTLSIVLILLLGWMAAEANWVRFIRVDVPLRNLPASFDGTTILFVADLHIDNFNTPEKTLRLMDQLSAAKPDILLLGGDYVSQEPEALPARIASLWTRPEIVNSELKLERRERFFRGISDFPAQLLRAGVPGNHDLALPGLDECMRRNNIVPLINTSIRINRGDDSIVLAGLDDWKDGERDIAAVAKDVTPEDCVILLSHSPDALPVAVNTPSNGGAGWVDLFLCAHTHGGQIRLFGHRGLAESSVYGNRYLTGLRIENGVIALTCNGVGTTGVPLRFFATPQVYLITLRCVS